MSTAHLVESIHEVFLLAPATAFRLSDAIRRDDFGLDRNTFEESWTTWRDVPSSQIARAACFFSYAPPEAAVYLAPRFMLFVLEQIAGDRTYRESDAGDFLIWWLRRVIRNNWQGAPFTAGQKIVVEQFLAAAGKDPEFALAVNMDAA